MVRTSHLVMTTPTTYPLEYDDDFCKSGPCGTGNCLGVLYFNTRPQNFCEDVTLQKDFKIFGELDVDLNYIVVGGVTYKETVIVDALGRSWIVLASRTSKIGNE